MDFKLGSRTLSLSLHPSFVTEDPRELLQSVSKYKPLQDFVLRFPVNGNVVIAQIQVLMVEFIAQRIESTTVEVGLASTKDKLAPLMLQRVTISDLNPVCVLPVATLAEGNKKFALLLTGSSVFLAESAPQPFSGTQQSNGGGLVLQDQSILRALGFDFSAGSLKLLGSQDGTLFGDECRPPVRLMSVSQSFPSVESLNTRITQAVAEAAKADGTSTLGLVAVPLEEVRKSSQDLRARLAATLVLGN